MSESQAVSLSVIMRAGRRDLLGKTGHDVIHHRTLQELIDEIREFGLSLLKHTRSELRDTFDKTAKHRIGFKL